MEELDFSGLLDTIDALYAKYNAFLLENECGPKYDVRSRKANRWTRNNKFG